MAVVFDLDDVEGVLGDFNGDLGCGGVEGVVEELFDEGEGVGEGLARAKGADGGGGESFDWHYAGDELEWVEEWVRGGGAWVIIVLYSLRTAAGVDGGVLNDSVGWGVLSLSQLEGRRGWRDVPPA